MPPTSQTHSHASDSPRAVVTGHSGECFGAQGCGDRGGQAGTGGSFPVAGAAHHDRLPAGSPPRTGAPRERGARRRGVSRRVWPTAHSEWPLPGPGTGLLPPPPHRARPLLCQFWVPPHSRAALPAASIILTRCTPTRASTPGVGCPHQKLPWTPSAFPQRLPLPGPHSASAGDCVLLIMTSSCGPGMGDVGRATFGPAPAPQHRGLTWMQTLRSCHLPP